MLQSSTRFTLRIERGWATWSYALTEPVTVGRQKNEVLALGYMLDTLRRFAGSGWTPARALLPGVAARSRPALESIFRCALAPGEAAGLVFRAELLEAENPAPRLPHDGAPPETVPPEADLVACIEQLVAAFLPGDRPLLAWMCRHLGLSRRSLQRRLAARGTSFEEIVQLVTHGLAAEMLARPGASITSVALALGYADASHFTRAFARRTGQTPRDWRDALRRGTMPAIALPPGR